MATGRRTAVLGPIDRLFRTGTATGLSDGQLLERFATRHDEAAEAAFAALVDRHGPMVFGVCRRILSDPNDAQDAFQATFLVLVRKAHRLRKADSLASWLYGVASRVSVHARSASARRRRAEGSAPSPSAVPPAAARDHEVWEEVDRLPETLRSAVVLCYLEGLTHEQASARLGWPVGTVRSRLARARDRLRTRLTRRGFAPGAAFLPVLSNRLASLPIDVTGPTARAAILFAARDAADAGLVSASAASLTEGVLRTMLVSKLKSAAVATLTAFSLAAGAAVFAVPPPVPPVPPVPPGPPAAEAPRLDEDLVESADEGAASDDKRDDFFDRVVALANEAREAHARGDEGLASRKIRELEAASRAWAARTKAGAVVTRTYEKTYTKSEEESPRVGQALRDFKAAHESLRSNAEAQRARASEAPPKTADQAIQRLNEAERELLTNVRKQASKELQDRLQQLEKQKAELELWFYGYIPQGKADPKGPPKPFGPTAETPRSRVKVVTPPDDTQRRLNALEDKLDRVLRSLEARPEATPRPRGGSDRPRTPPPAREKNPDEKPENPDQPEPRAR